MFANHNWIQEVQVIGLGANAEYGGFTGVASNSLFRSGSNMFTGLFETLYENDALTGEQHHRGDPRTRTSPHARHDRLRDRHHVPDRRPDQAGQAVVLHELPVLPSEDGARRAIPPTRRTGIPSRASVPTRGSRSRRASCSSQRIKLGETDQLTGFFETDSYTVDGRGAGATRRRREATVHQDSPEVAWNVNYTKVLSASSVFDVKYSGFWGYYYLSPYNGDDTPGWYDVDENFYARQLVLLLQRRPRRAIRRTRASPSSRPGFAGEHNLKFGAEFERSYIKSEYGYPGGMYVLADFGVPYYAYLWDGYLKDSINTRFAAFAQDRWAIGSRLTINPGIRFDRIAGYNKALDEQVFTTNSWAPRIGFAWDIAGNSKTVVRGHYGRYFDGAKSIVLRPARSGHHRLSSARISTSTSTSSDGPYLVTPGHEPTRWTTTSSIRA